MKKSLKAVSLFLTLVTVSSSVLPNVSTVYAMESIRNDSVVNEVKYTPRISMTEYEIDRLASEIQKLHKGVSKEWIKEVIRLQLKGDYSIPAYTSSSSIDSDFMYTRSSWQGITVNQMGAMLDTAIAVSLGGATAGLAHLIKAKGKHEAKRALKNAIAGYFGSWFLNNVVLEFALNLLSPGTYLAQLWDSRDKIPNNGRINF